MVLVKEFRIRNNCTVEEYRIAQLFAVAKMSLNETGGGEGVEVIKNEPYDDEHGKGQYTYKIYHLASRAPAIVRALAPKEALELHEEAWNGYPSCRTVTTSPWMKDSFKMVTETMHLADRGETENALKASPETMAQREVVYLDVADDGEVPKASYKESEDPKKYKSAKTGRGPLGEKWAETCDPVMTCYKLVTVEFKWWGLQTTVEALIMSYTRKAMLLMHRQLFCDTDEWFGMTIDELRKMEEETAKTLLEKRHKQLENMTDFS
ncbi:hypothetical protein GGF46_001817 [Coemansia sp. RSA 552]|nr:hypothetical protein GGF46_001817 [Coemansia sp. RSA 552]